MKRSILAALFASALFSGCAFFSAPSPGMPEETLISIKGKPDVIYQDGENKILEWGMGTWGQYTYMAKIGPDGKLISYEQVLDLKKFYTIKINEYTKEQVLKTVGRPIEVDFLPLAGLEVWAYRHKEENIWHSMMYIYFDEQGIVRRMENGMDPIYARDN